MSCGKVVLKWGRMKRLLPRHVGLQLLLAEDAVRRQVNHVLKQDLLKGGFK